MMTFIIMADFILNAALLDDQRLGKQRVEAKQIVDIIEGKKKAWSNHPIVLAWTPFLIGLKYYTNCIISEWINRGRVNNMELYPDLPDMIPIPWWAQWDRLIQSHRAMLLRKDPFYYKNKFTCESEYNQYGYIWPHKISYENRMTDLELITAPIPKELANPVYCCGILQSGNRKNQSCNRLVKHKQADVYPYCTIHLKML